MVSSRTSVVDHEFRSRGHCKRRNKRLTVLISSLLLLMELNHVNGAPLNDRNSWRNVTIISKEGKYLAITRKGVKGEDTESSYSKLLLRSVGLYGEVTMRGVEVAQFIAMRSSGQVYLTNTSTIESVFIDGYVNNNMPYRSFRSKHHPNNYLAISQTGFVSNSVANGKKTLFALI